MRHFIPLVMSVCSSLSASEALPIELRVNVLLTPETEEVDATYRFANGTGSQVESATLDPGYRVEIGLVTRFVEVSRTTSIVGGGWVFYGEQKGDSGNDLGLMSGPRSYLVFGVDFYIALRKEFNQYVSMEIGPVVGAGTTRFSDYIMSGTTTVEGTGHGEYEEAGINLQFIMRNPTNSVSSGLGVRYLLSYGEAENRFNSMVQDVEVEQHGLAPYLTFGVNF